MAKQTRNLLFLKSTGVLIGEVTDGMDLSVLDLSQFQTKEVTFNIDNQEYWHGDFATGSVQSKLDKPVVAESHIKYFTNIKVLEQYPVHKQLNIIIDMLSKSELPKTEEFEVMKDYLDTLRSEHRDKVVAYSSNSEAYVWVSEEEEKLQATKKVV